MTLYTGNTVEEAIERGLKRERISRENAHIEIEQRESNGFFGVGKKRARVNIEPIHEDTVRRADRLATRHLDQSDMEVPEAETAMEATLRLHEVVKAVREANIQTQTELTDDESDEDVADSESEGSTERPKDEASEISKIDAISDLVSSYLIDIASQMGIPTEVKVVMAKGEMIFNLGSEHDALLIGKHGKILSSLETVAKAYVNTLTDKRISISVNVGDYREKRVGYLTSLANRAAERANAGETVYINDLPASERKIVHNVIAKIDGVNSHSEGNDKQRYIVVTQDI